MKVSLAVLGISLAVLGCARTETRGGSSMRVFDYSGFTVVESGFGIEVGITQAPDHRIAVFASPAMLEKVQVELTDRTLSIGLRRVVLPPWTLNRKIRVEITLPTLEGLSASGGSPFDVVMDAPTGRLVADLSGGSRLTGSLTAASLAITGSGGSTVTLTGGATELKLSGTGGSRFRMADFTAVSLDADLAGGSTVDCNVSETLVVRASGGSHVVYHGDASVQAQDLSGGSWIRRD